MKQRRYARILLVIIILQVISYVPAYALTGGPAQPEFQSFEPVTTTEMVNLPDGGFTYNLPLMDIGGYPLNLSYHSDITSDMEASCVGLGWSVNPGVINRNVRALPDDFSGDVVTKKFNLKPNNTYGASLAVSYELFGYDALKKAMQASMKMGMSMGLFYNNYWGVGYEFGLSPSISAGKKGGGSLTGGIGLNVNSQSGANFSPSLTYSRNIDGKDKKSRIGMEGSVATSISSREGMKSISFSSNIETNNNINKKEGDKTVYSANVATSGSNSGSFNFAGSTFTPEFTMPQNNVSVTVNFKPAGLELFGSNGTAEISGYYSSQAIRNKVISKNAYGMIYSHRGRDNENALMDFNREKDGAFFDYSIHLPIVNPGFDVLNVNGQGTGGSFQLKRSDVPIFFDAKSTAESFGGSLGIELGNGNTAHVGVDLKFNYTNSTSRKWTDRNDLLQNYNFFENAIEGYEPAYYKAAGEMAIESDPLFYYNLGKDIPVRADLESPAGSPFKVGTKPFLKDENGVFYGGSPKYRSSRDRRNQVISWLTAQEADTAGLDKRIVSYPLNQFVNPPQPVKIKRYAGSRAKHHISQIEAMQPDGLRHIYGIPAYNFVQKEVTFNVSTHAVNCDTGTVYYVSGVDNSENNMLGQDRYFNAVETPAFAHTYLLTTVLSKDYEDLNGNGPTEDDFGSYTKINYGQVKVTNGNSRDSIYHWRVPFGANKATYNPGFYSKTHDDKGNYIYGQKEIWMVHSIESKTMVAEFYYSPRDDGYGVIDENGGRAAKNLNQKLDSIVLYAKPDRLKNKFTATPIKVVHFNYNYSLCPDTENSVANISASNPTVAKRGKLTLVGVYFTYGHSKKGRLSDYAFFYKNSSRHYSSKDYDRWGYYKENATSSGYPSLCKNPGPSDPLTNDEFPFAEQNKIKADKDAGTWSLDSIALPSGGSIKVDYKAKHYAYVQDQPAMRLLKIAGIASVGGKQLYPIGGVGGLSTNYLKLYFDLDDPLQTNTREELGRDYMRNIQLNHDYIYLKCYVRLNAAYSQSEKWEYVSLYSQITNYGVENGKGYVLLKPLKTSDDHLNAQNLVLNHLNPICKFALQSLRENHPEIAYDQEPVTESSLAIELSTFTALMKMWKPIVELMHGFQNVCILRGYTKEISLARSFIRLYDPDGIKYGGGSHVSKIQIHDNWGKMTNSNDNFSYGQEYDYMTTGMKSDGTPDTLSSGVASYEPMIGGEENPLKVPDVVSEERKFAIDNVHYVEKPYGEAFMPAPQVVYSKITVRNLKHKDVVRTATGHTVMEYYTAKDFPVKTRQTDLQKMPRRISPILALLKVKVKEHMNASMGYLIETNNMHGQAKSNEIFDEKGTQISGVYFHYKTNAAGELDNEVEVVHPDGSVTNGMLGVTYQLAGDARESKSKTTSGGLAVNLDVFIIGVYPVTVPVPWPSFEQSEEQFRSMSMTKLVHKFGILERTEAYDLGSKIATENLAYDAETGEILLTRTYNEFNDPVYNCKLPGHVAYKGLQGAYKNIGFQTKTNTTNNNGGISNGICHLASTTAAFDFYMPGDEVLLDGITHGWVLHVDDVTNRLFLIDRDGVAISQSTLPAHSSITLKTIRSGFRNMPTTQIGTITSLKNPIQNGFIQLSPSTDVLHAEAIEYGDHWQTYCSVGQYETEFDTNCFARSQINPYVRNVLGDWRPVRSWLYLTERERSIVASSSTNIRMDGTYNDFTPFWKPSHSSSLWSKDQTDWIWSATTTQINPHGTELESKNRLYLYSAEILGYYQQLVTGVASNSLYQQIAFEGFEDFQYNSALASKLSCQPPRHFGDGFERCVSNKTFHTGKYSLEITPSLLCSTSNMTGDTCNQNQRSTTTNTLQPYFRNDCECIKVFAPLPGKYIVTAWVKEGDGLGYKYYNKHELKVNTGSSSKSFQAKGMIIDGWQRIEGEFDILSGDPSVTFDLKALGTNLVYFDDIRIFPYNGNMKNYVYDDVSLKLLAELDANGFAKFYEYSQEGELIRIKQETERGIMTIQDSWSSMPK